jgi:hypothetical protein
MKKEEVLEIKRKVAGQIFEHYAKSTFPEEIFSKMSENTCYSELSYKLIDRGILINEEKYSIIYEICFHESDEEEKEMGIENSYVFYYLFLDYPTKTICDAASLFDSFAEHSEWTIEKELQEKKEKYLEIIRNSIEHDIEFYKEDNSLLNKGKHIIKRRIIESKNMIKTLFPDLLFKIPKEIFKD